MARKSIYDDAAEEQQLIQEEVPATQEQPDKTAEEQKSSQVDSNVDHLMRLYPYLEKMWITPSGFVHPEGVPKHYREGATLYKNKYYKR